jgi:hypothetical protein
MIEDTGRVRSPDPAGVATDAEVDDDVLATSARARFRSEGIVGIEPDERMAAVLGQDEELVAVRQSASIERLSEARGSSTSRPLAITPERLLILDAELPVTLASLEELDDVTVVTDRLLVLLRDGAGFTITTSQPRLLRVELAAARASRMDPHTAASSSSSPAPPSDLP